MKQMTIMKTMRKEYNDNNITIHADIDRKRRIIKANNLINVEHAKLFDSFVCDCGHKGGKEIHNIYNNGVIKIYNADSKMLITVLIGTYNQVQRYYNACGIKKYIPIGIKDKCKMHH